MFSESDKKFIEERGSSFSEVEKQIGFFKSGFPSLPLKAPALVGDGIKKLSEDEVASCITDFNELSGSKKIVKFVPASGAASRMFKVLFGFMDSYDGSESAYQQMIQDSGAQSPFTFFKNLEKFAFYDDLKAIYKEKNGATLEEDHVKREYVKILEYFLTERGLDYGNLPKGLLKFHKYDDSSRTPAEEHLVEGAHYAKDNNGNVPLHFTVSPEHRDRFRSHIDAVKESYEKAFSVNYQVSFSEQKKSTDTIAVDMNNEPFRNPDGTLLFRPAGHGALIENLNELDADVAIIKNIDNVVPDHLKSETYSYKKVITGILLRYQEKIFHYLELIEGDLSEEIVSEIEGFVEQDLCIKSHLASGTPTEERVRFLKSKLNRPIRVCGVVSSEGDPGGGPFWAKNPDNTISLQIAETAQIDLEDPDQKSIFGKATHFNPVDLVCSLKDFNGKQFDLLEYRDPMTGFITQKSKDGKELKALELPGLWNGAMSDWNTVFVEVPVITFNPVKAVNDLLKPEHQPAQ